MTAPASEKGARHLTRQGKNRRIDAERGEQGGGCVENAGAGHHRTYAGPAGRARISHRHIGTGLFVARADDANTILFLMECVEQSVGLGSRQSEDRIHPMPQ